MNIRRRTEAGMTLVEVAISIVILTIVTGGIAAALVTSLNGSRSSGERVRESNDAQVIASFLERDAQAAGGSNPATGTVDPNLGVSLTDPKGCGSATGLKMRFAWTDRAPGATHTHVATYTLSAATNQLVRTSCVDGGAAASATLGNHVAGVTGSCSPVANCPGLPDSVSLAIAETNSPQNALVPYTYTLTASLRPQAQAQPDSGNSESVPLLALGGGAPCGAQGTANGLFVQGNSTVIVNGDVVVDATDGGGCTAMSAAGSVVYSADSTAILAGGTCSGNKCGTTTTESSPLQDPFASLPAPGDCSGAQTGSFSAGHYSAGVYKSSVNVTSTVTFDPGIYIFCAGVTLSAGANVTANGVLFYIAQGALTIDGHASISMTAMTNPPYAHLLVWMPRTNTTTSLTINGSSSVDTYGGVIYAPNVDVVVTGTAGNIVGGIIARTISFAGNGSNIIGSTALAIRTKTLPSVTTNIAYSFTMSASGGTTPYHWSASGLPAGLTMNAGSGTIAGTSSANGSHPVTVTVTDSAVPAASVSRTYTLVVTNLSITTASLPTGEATVTYSKPLALSGGTAPYTWSATGLPAGLSMNASTGAISGTPTASGTFIVIVNAGDSASPPASVQKAFGLTIASPVSVATASLPDGESGVGYSTTVAASNGVAPYAWTATGLPAGLTLNAGTGTISGTPTSTGTASVTVKVTDALGATASATLPIVRYAQLSVTGPGALGVADVWTQGRSFLATATATGGSGTYTWAASGLPAGLAINAGTGAISGTPLVVGTLPQTFPVVVTATDTATPAVSATKSYSLVIVAAPQVTTTACTAQKNKAIGFTLKASGGTAPLTWTAGGTKPVWVTLNGATGVLTGTAPASGTFAFTVTVTDASGSSASATFTITVASGAGSC